MRTKILAGNLLVVMAIGLIAYLLVSTQVEQGFTAEVDTTIQGDFQLLDRQWRLSCFELLSQTRHEAAQNSTQEVFTALDEERQRTRAFERANEIAANFSRPGVGRGSRPDLVLITDDRGVGIARDQDRNRLNGANLTSRLPTLAAVLEDGEARIDLSRFSEGQPKLLQIAVVAVRDRNGQVAGAVVVGYDLSNGMASSLSQHLNRKVAFIVEDQIYSSSLGSQAVGLRTELFGERLGPATAAALSDAGRISERYLVEVNGTQYVGVTGPLAFSRSTPVGYAVLANRSEQVAKAAPASTILIMTAVGALLVLIYSFFIAGLFLRPLAEMEEGVLAVINGRTDLRLDIQSAEFGGLAYRINQLLNVFTGTPEEDSEGRVSYPPGAWTDEDGADLADETPPPPAQSRPSSGEEEDPELAAELEAEPEDEYYSRIFAEYVAAKEAVGENVSNITEDRFVKRLQANEKSLIKKHDCRMVRFQVHTRGTQVNLRPVIIR